MSLSLRLGLPATLALNALLVCPALAQDTDNDGLPDSVETNTGTWLGPGNTGTHPNNPDTDGDTLLDGVETFTGTFVSAGDTGTSPLDPDSDNDGFRDGDEVTAGTDPNDPASFPALWIGPDGGDWNDPANWDPVGVPGEFSNAVISVGRRVIISDAVSVGALRILNSGNVLELDPNAALNVVGDLEVAEGSAILGEEGNELTVGGPATVEGTLELIDAAAVTYNLVTVAADGRLTLQAGDGGGSADRIIFNGEVQVAGELSIDAASSDQTLLLKPTFIEAGGVLAVRNSALKLQGDLHVDGRFILENTGATQMGGAAVQVGATGELFAHHSTVVGTVNNSGLLAPGLSVGSLTIDGPYNQLPGGTLRIELGGLGVLHDRLDVTGPANLAGNLEVSLAPGYEPAPGNRYLFLTGNEVVGNFSNVSYPAGFGQWSLDRSNPHQVAAEFDLLDADGDQIDDGWEAANGGDLDPDGDPDGDGRTNSEEWSTGTDPNDPSSFFQPSVIEHTGGAFEITIYTSARSNYQLEYTADLASADWAPITLPILGSNAPMTFVDDSLEGERGFYRIGATRANLPDTSPDSDGDGRSDAFEWARPGSFDPNDPDDRFADANPNDPGQSSGGLGSSGDSFDRPTVGLATGEATHTATDMAVPGRMMDFAWQRTYRSRFGPETTAMGYGWTHSHDISLDQSGSNLVLHNGRGRSDHFTPDGAGKWTRAEFFHVISQNPDNTYTATFPDQAAWNFAALDASPAAGKITSMVDHNGNTLRFVYDAMGRLETITDDLGRDYIVAYNADGLVASVTDFTERAVTYDYYGVGEAGGSPGDLKSVTSPPVTGTPNGNDFPAGKTTTYTYTKGFADETLNHNLLTVTDPKGQVILVNEYAATRDVANRNYDQLIRQTRGNPGEVIDYSYEVVTPAVANNFALARTIVNDREGHVKEHYFDARGYRVMAREFTGTAHPDSPTTGTVNRPTGKLRSTDPDFYLTRWDYNDDGLLASVVHPNQNVVAVTYDLANLDRRLQGNLTQRRALPGPLGGDQPELVESWSYLAGFGGPQFVESYIDRRGHTVSHGYDANGNPTRTTERIASIVTNREYNTHGQLIAVVHPNNGSGHRRRDKFTYHQIGPLTGYLESTIVDVGGLALTTTYDYNPRAAVILRVDPRGHDTHFVRNQLDQVVRERSAEVTTASSNVRYERDTFYDANDNVVRVDVQNRGGDGVLDAGNPHFTSLYEYDRLNFPTRVIEELDPTRNVVIEYSYDGNRNRTLVRLGEATNGNQPQNVIRYAYDERDLLYREIRGAGSADQSSTQFDYDGNGNLVMVSQGLESANPRFSTYTRDGYNRRTEARDPMGNLLRLSYNANSSIVNRRLDGELNDVPGSAGNVRLAEVTYQYDDLNRLTSRDQKHFDPTTQAEIGDGSSITAWDHADFSQILSVTNDNAHAATYRYDTANRLLERIDAAGNSRTFTYDGNGNLLHVDEADHSDLGNPDQLTTTSFAYDTLNRQTGRTDNVGNVASYTYDSRGNLAATDDALENDRTYEYDGLNRLLTTTRVLREGGLGSGQQTGTIVTSQAWDDSSRLLSRTDANSNITLYSYDPLGRRIQTARADGTTSHATYDVHHNTVETIDPNGTVVAHQHDLLNRVTQNEVLTHGPNVSTALALENYQYDGLSRLVRATDEDSNVTREFDSLSNLRLEDLNGRVTAADYDGMGNQLSCVYPGGRTIDRVYDNLERVTRITEGAATIADPHYVGGRMEGADLGNGTQVRYTYDGLTGIRNAAGDFGVKRIQRSLHTRISDGMVIDDRNYRYDKVQNRRARRDERPGPGRERFEHLYELDSAYRLVRTRVLDRDLAVKRDEQYALDAFGNRASVDGGARPGVYTRDDTFPEPADYQVNQYTTTAFDARAYDQNGNLRSIDAGQPDEMTYTYDYRNRLVKVDDNPAGLSHQYKFDALGRRTERIIDTLGGDEALRFFYDHHGRVVEEQDEIGTTTATYVRGPGGGVVTMQRGAADHYYHHDAARNVMALTDTAGAVVERSDYGDHGQILDAATLNEVSGNPSAVGNPFFAKGGRYDHESGFYHLGGSSHDATAGRLTSSARASGVVNTSGTIQALQFGGERQIGGLKKQFPGNNVPGELLALEGDTIFTQDTVWGDPVVETAITRLGPRGDKQIGGLEKSGLKKQFPSNNSAIATFQKKAVGMARADSRVDPGGKSFTTLAMGPKKAEKKNNELLGTEPRQNIYPPLDVNIWDRRRQAVMVDPLWVRGDGQIGGLRKIQGAVEYLLNEFIAGSIVLEMDQELDPILSRSFVEDQFRGDRQIGGLDGDPPSYFVFRIRVTYKGCVDSGQVVVLGTGPQRAPPLSATPRK